MLVNLANDTLADRITRFLTFASLRADLLDGFIINLLDDEAGSQARTLAC